MPATGRVILVSGLSPPGPTVLCSAEPVHFHVLHKKDFSRVKEVWYCAEEDNPSSRSIQIGFAPVRKCAPSRATVQAKQIALTPDPLSGGTRIYSQSGARGGVGL